MAARIVLTRQRVLLSLVLASTAVRAVSLPEALAYAREHTPSLAAQRARVEAAAAEARVARAQWLPRVSVGAALFAGTTNNSTTSVIGVPGVDLPRIGATPLTGSVSFAPSPSTLVGLAVRQELFDFGRIAAQSAAADLLADAERERASAEELEIRLAVEEAFLAVKAATAVLAAAEGARERARVSRDTARAGVQGGLRKPIELTRAEADLSRFDVGRVRAAGGVTAAQALFAAAVGSAEPLLDAAGEPPVREEPVAVADALELAQTREPALKAARASVTAQQARTHVIATERRPDLWASAAFSSRAGGATPNAGPVPFGAGWLPVVPNWDVGVVLTWPLLDFVSLRREDASEQLEHVREAELQLAQQRLTAAVQQTYVAFQSAREAVPALERALLAATENHAQAKARFDAGLSQALELADAEALRTEAEIQLALGKFELARTRARLARVTAETQTP